MKKLDIKEITLSNGLKVITLEDHFIPIVSYFTLYKVGSRNEIPGITGISHLFEHMMFKGSKKFNNVSFDKILEPMGGYSNAYTSRDMTVYYENFPPDALKLVVELDSDRMSNLNLEIEELDSEREVVKEERRYRTDNSIIGKMDEVLYSSAYSAHSYRNPIVGWMPDLDNISLERCREYLSTYYNPVNSRIVVVGDFITDELVSMIEENYGNIQVNPGRENLMTQEPGQSGEKRIECPKAAQIYSIMAGYHVPEVKSGDTFALEVLQTILTDGEGSHLQRELIYKQQKAVAVYSDFTWRIDPSLFVFYIQMKPGVTGLEGENAVYNEIDKIKEGGISDSDIIKAKNKLESSFWDTVKTATGLAEKIGVCELLFDDYTFIYNVLDEFNKIQKEDIIAVVDKYFKKSNRTVVTLIPQS
ncbi:M16 family metallopeptidase [candidate division KSB1 bacterium]